MLSSVLNNLTVVIVMVLGSDYLLCLDASESMVARDEHTGILHWLPEISLLQKLVKVQGIVGKSRLGVLCWSFPAIGPAG